MSRLPILLACLPLALFAASCGDDEEPASAPPAATATATPEPATAGAPDLGAISEDLSEKPAVEQPSGEPPAELYSQDIVKGKGPGAKKGNTVVVNYVGLNFSNGREFDASWDSGATFPVQLGTGSVIAGWEKGLIGIKEGGRRKLVIPPELGYGAQGYPPDIPPNETLVFVVDAVAVEPG